MHRDARAGTVKQKLQITLEVSQLGKTVSKYIKPQNKERYEGYYTYMIDVQIADQYEHQNKDCKVHNRVNIAVELYSSHADALPLQGYTCRYNTTISTHVLHACW